jgi:Mannitol repressor
MWLVSDLTSPAGIGELEHSSDRAVGVIVGAIVDSMLSDALRREFRRDESPYSAKVRKEIFQSEGPLGTFGAKIGMSYLMGYFTPEAHTDLQNLKNIRNLFAHYAEHNTFKSQKIQALCSNFALINTRIRGPSAWMTRGSKTHVYDSVSSGDNYICLNLVNPDDALKEPKERFINTAK